MEKAYRAEEVEMQVFAITRANDFIFSEEGMKMMVGWLTEHKGKVVIKGKALAMTISAELGYNIIRKAYKASGLTEDDYLKMNETVFQG